VKNEKQRVTRKSCPTPADSVPLDGISAIRLCVRNDKMGLGEAAWWKDLGPWAAANACNGNWKQSHGDCGQ
jgi:hypothetical protein